MNPITDPAHGSYTRLSANYEKLRTRGSNLKRQILISRLLLDTTALLKDHLVETLTRGLQRSVASLKSIDLEYVGNNIGVGAGRQ